MYIKGPVTETLFQQFHYTVSILDASQAFLVALDYVQGRQSARLFHQSSELGPPPSPAGECIPPPPPEPKVGGHTCLQVRGGVGPNSDEGTDTVVL